MDPCFEQAIHGLSLAVALSLLLNPRIELAIHGLPASHALLEGNGK